MKFAGARGITRSRVPLIAMLALAATIGLAGCEGDDGKDGQPGAPGAAGPSGPSGPAGPTGPVAGIEKPLESCAVCHGDSSIASVATAHAGAKDISVTNVTIGQSATVPADLVLTFNVKADGAPFTTLTTAARQYQFNGTLRNTLNSIDSTVPGDVLTPATLSGGASGNYTITIAGGFTQYGAVPSRYLFRLETGVSGDPRAMVTADFPSAPDKALVSTAGCSGCHANDGAGGFHYSYPANGANCTVCHDATNTNYPRLVNIGHGVHNSELMPAGEYVLETVDKADSWTYAVTFPTYMTNCSICHTGTETTGALAEVNKMPVTYTGCLTCHGSMASWQETWDAEPVLAFHATMTEQTVCSQCHAANALADLDTVAEMHNGLETERVGIIWNGEDKSVTEGKKFTWDITGITDDGTNLKITWVATYNGSAVNPCNTTVAAGAPGFFPYGPNTANEGTISVLRSYVQGDDYVLGKASGPGQAASVNLSKDSTADGYTTCSTTSPFTATTTVKVDAGVTAGTRGVIALQGKPTIPVPTGFSSSLHAAEWPYTTMFARVPTPVREFVVGTGDLPTTTRRPVADTAACLACHVGSLYQHGNNRVDNVDLCVMCHNSASSDQNNRAQMGVTASEAYDGKVGQTYELKTMLHALHTVDSAALNPADKTFAIYRTRGIYAWAPEGVTPPNWSTTKCEKATPTAGQEYLVNGADPALDVSCQPHTLYHPTFPRPNSDCAACHKAGFSTMVDQTKGVATTIDAGAAPWNNQLDDVLQGANSAACTSCHRDAASAGHANQNGWVPTTFPNGRQTIIDAAK